MDASEQNICGTISINVVDAAPFPLVDAYIMAIYRNSMQWLVGDETEIQFPVETSLCSFVGGDSHGATRPTEEGNYILLQVRSKVTLS